MDRECRGGGGSRIPIFLESAYEGPWARGGEGAAGLALATPVAGSLYDGTFVTELRVGHRGRGRGGHERNRARSDARTHISCNRGPSLSETTLHDLWQSIALRIKAGAQAWVVAASKGTTRSVGPPL